MPNWPMIDRTERGQSREEEEEEEEGGGGGGGGNLSLFLAPHLSKHL